MASREASAVVAIALLAGAVDGVRAQVAAPAPQRAPATPPQAVPATPPQAAPATPPQEPAAAADDPAAGKRLGRKYPVASPPSVVPREPPDVHVSVVSPRDSGVHQHGARERMQRATRVGENPGGAVAPSPPLP